MLLSVIIPVYNVEKYLRDCLESVIRQKTDDLELIIINDGSTDRSEAICLEYTKLYPDIIYEKQENAGLGDARNAGLAHAKGEYVIFLDSDDYWREDLLGFVLSCLQENPGLDILYFDSDVIYEDEQAGENDSYDSRMYHREASVKNRIYKGAEFFVQTYPLHFNVQACMAAFRKAFLEEYHIVFPEGIFFEDHLFSVKAVLYADTVRYLPQRLYLRRYHANSITTGAIDEKRIRDYIQVIRLMAEFVDSGEILESIKKKKLSYEALLLRKMRDKVFSLVQTFFEMCSLSAEKPHIICSFQKEMFGKLYQMTEKRRMTDMQLEELEACLFLGSYFEDDTEQYLKDRGIVSKDFSFRTFFCDCKRAYQEKADCKFKRMGIFAHDKKTGIYGLGNHTKGLLKAAKQRGKLPADLFLLDSHAASGEWEFEGLSVINIRDIPADTDQIIISSFLYDQELYENAVKYAREHVKINRIYQNEVRELCWRFL